MIITIYVLLSVAGLGLFILSMLYSGKAVMPAVMLPLTAFVLFAMLGISSLNIEQPSCHNQVTATSTITAGNTTTTAYSNTISCATAKSVNEPLAWLFGGLSLFAMVVAVLQTIRAFQASP